MSPNPGVGLLVIKKGAVKSVFIYFFAVKTQVHILITFVQHLLLTSI